MILESRNFLKLLVADLMEHVAIAIKQSEERIIMTTKAQLDAVIAALPGQIETAVETALQTVIAAIQSSAAINGVDLTDEVAQLQAIPAAVASSVATAVTPVTPAA